MKTEIIRIGNSRGVRLPKLLLDKAGLTGEVEIEASPGQLVIRSAKRPRQGWEEQFAAMASAGDDALLEGDELMPTEWESQEWQW
jgi:antitoxin MazE